MYIYIITSYAFLFRNITKYQLNDEAFKIWLYFDFHKSFAHTGIIYVSCVYIYMYRYTCVYINVYVKKLM